jgi:hypothetical protein
MALSILDGNQSATTLSTIVTSGQHIPAHTVVSLGSNAISNIATAISGSTVCVGNLGLLQSTVATEGISASGSFIKIGGHTGTSTTGNIVHVSSVGALRVDGSAYTQPVSIASVTIGNTVTIAGSVTANPTGTQTIAGTVALGASTAQIGSVTANISGTVPVSISSVTIGNSITIGSCVTHGVTISNSSVTVNGTFFQATQPVSLATLPALVSGTAQIGSVTVGNTVTIAGTVTANPTGTQTISGSVTLGAGTAQIGSVTASFAISSSAITSGSFSSLISATLVPANTARKMATIYNLGAGQLFVNAGATCTTLGGGFMVALSVGDFYECPYTTTTLSAIFATAGTASWVSH